jgi:polysaccharide pyruvyl transferase WcaK-like protein
MFESFAEGKETRMKPKKIAFYGFFGQENWGNECTLQTIFHNTRKYFPDAQFKCICLDPEDVTIRHNIPAVPMRGIIFKPGWLRGHPLTKFLRKVIIGIPSELYRWLEAFRTLKGIHMLIVPGSGFLTDAYSHPFGWPYDIFKWSLIAKLCHCQLLYVSMGAGPIYHSLSRWFIKSALSLADFRSYRDHSTAKYLKSIGFSTNNDRVYPDLVFNLAEVVIPHGDIHKMRRRVVGIGLMIYPGQYSIDKPSNAMYRAYLENLVIFVRWLLTHDYDVRLLIGDKHDRSVTQEFRELLKQDAGAYDEDRIIEEAVFSVEQLLSQLAATDLVVATRYHNVLLALILGKPAISISFHHKCVSLMRQIGLSEYCQDINQLDADRLIEQFCDLEKNAEKLRPLIKQKIAEFRGALDKQYNIIFNDV